MKPTMRGLAGFAALLTVAALAGCFAGSATEVAATAATGAPAVWRWSRTAAGDLRFTVELAFTIESDAAPALVSDPWKATGDR